MNKRDALLTVQNLLAPHGPVHWPRDLQLDDDGRLAPPGQPGPWFILWNQGSVPWSNWAQRPPEDASIQLSCGGRTDGEALAAESIAKSVLPANQFLVTNTGPTSYGGGSGNRIVIIPVVVSVPVAAT